MVERQNEGIRTREPIEQGEAWEFVENFNLVLSEHGLDHRYYTDGPRRYSMELSDVNSFNRHEIIQPIKKKILGRKLWTKYRTVARILSDSQRDPGPSIFSQIPHNGLLIEVLEPEDKDLIDRVIDGLHEIYPDEEVQVYLK